MKKCIENNNKEMNAKMLSLASRLLVVGVFLALLVLTIQACNRAGSFEGTYVNSAGSEFSIAHDTLIVEHSQGQRYLLHRSTGFRLLDNAGKPGKMQYEKEEWTAVLDAESGMLTESRKGKQICFSGDGQTMTVGMRKYKRIN